MIVLPKEVQGMAVNQSFFVISQKKTEKNELLVAFSRHKYKMMIYVDGSFGVNDIDKLEQSINY